MPKIMLQTWFPIPLLALCVLSAAPCGQAYARQGGLDGKEVRAGQFEPAVVQNAPIPSQGKPTLPNGATSILETYGDWTVQCRIVKNEKRCTLNQVLANQQTGQTGLAIDLLPTADGGVSGRILSPLGIRLGDGLVLEIDKSAPALKLQFTHCVLTGCIAPVRFDEANINTLKTETTLVAQVTAETNGQPISFRISLNGFAAALARTTGLQ